MKEIRVNQQDDGSFKIESELPVLPMPMVEKLLNEAIACTKIPEEMLDKLSEAVSIIKVQRWKIRILWIVIALMALAMITKII